MGMSLAVVEKICLATFLVVDEVNQEVLDREVKEGVI